LLAITAALLRALLQASIFETVAARSRHGGSGARSSATIAGVGTDAAASPEVRSVAPFAERTNSRAAARP
jgi:hypothetical protein